MNILSIQNEWAQPPSIDVCATQCKAKCCKSGYLFLTVQEKLRLQTLNQTIKWLKHDKTFWVLDFATNGGQCPNLTQDNLCSIWEQRPEACSSFPTKPYPGCLVFPQEETLPLTKPPTTQK